MENLKIAESYITRHYNKFGMVINYICMWAVCKAVQYGSECIFVAKCIVNFRGGQLGPQNNHNNNADNNNNNNNKVDKKQQ